MAYGLSSAEVEILLKMRAQGADAIDLFGGTLGKAGAAGKTAAGGIGEAERATKSSGLAAGAGAIAFGLLADRVGRALLGEFKNTITESNKLDAALIGLASSARAFGTDAGAAQMAANALASDGLMSVGEAATGLKNLLAAGFGLDQAVVLMNRFKDSAAFGRQGTLDFGQAIVGATEGIKNGNSALVDNAGLTKNLSVILQENGKSANDLQKVQSDLNVRTALYNGILKETNPQLGDAARYSDTAAGAQARFSSEVTTTEQKIGKGLQPILRSTLALLAPLARAVGDNAGAVISMGLAVAGIVGPLVAMKAASALGIPSLATLGEKAINAMLAFEKASLATGTLRGGLNGLAIQAGITYGQLGLLGSAAAVAGTAFIAWNLGRAIAQVFDLDSKIASLVNRFQVLIGTAPGLEQVTSAAKWDSINKAIRDGATYINAYASETDKYTAAVKFNNDMAIAQTAIRKNNVGASREAIEAEVRLGIISREFADTLLLQMNVEKELGERKKARAQLGAVEAAIQKEVNAEILKTGFTVEELTKKLATNEIAFKAYAKTQNLSADTMKFLEDRVTSFKTAAKESSTAAEKWADVMRDLSGVGADFDATVDTINGSTVEAIKYYLAAGISQETLAKAYGVTAAQVGAVKDQSDYYADTLGVLSSVGADWQATVESLDGSVVEAIKFYLEAGVSQETLAKAYGLTGIQVKAVKELTDKYADTLKKARALEAESKGLSGPINDAEAAASQKFWSNTAKSIDETKAAWNDYYGLVDQRTRSSTDAAILQVRRLTAERLDGLDRDDANYRNYVAAIKALEAEKIRQILDENNILIQAARQAKDDLLGIWQGFSGSLGSLFLGLGHDIDGSLHETAAKARETWQQMTLDGKSTPDQIQRAFEAMREAEDKANYTFGERFKDVWTSIKQSLLKIFDDILGAFVNSFLAGMINGITGARGGFASAFAGLFSSLGSGGGRGGGTGGVDLGGILGGLFKGGGATPFGASGPGIVQGPGISGVEGFDKLGAGSGAIGNLARFGGGGLTAAAGLYQLFTAKSRKGQVLGGFQAGAGIGTMILPGIGTVVGAGVGALAGYLKGIGKPNKQELEGREVVAGFEANLATNLTGEQKKEAGGDAWKATLIAARDAYLKTGRSAADAERDVKALWDSSKGGAEAATIAAKKIQDAIDEAAKKSKDATATEEAKAAEAKARDEERAKRIEAMNARLSDLTTQRDDIAKTYADEAPEEVMGKTEADARAKVDQINQQMEAVRRQIEAVKAEADAATVDAATTPTQTAASAAAAAGAAAGVAAEDSLTASGIITGCWGRAGEGAKIAGAITRDELGGAADETGAKFDGAIGGVISQFGLVGPEAERVRAELGRIFGGLGFTIPIRYDVQGAPPPPNPPPAAEGVYAVRPQIRTFGEGGEPELGGPVSFMSKALAGALERLGAGAAEPPPPIVVMQPAAHEDRPEVAASIKAALTDALSGLSGLAGGQKDGKAPAALESLTGALGRLDDDTERLADGPDLGALVKGLAGALEDRQAAPVRPAEGSAAARAVVAPEGGVFADRPLLREFGRAPEPAASGASSLAESIARALAAGPAAAAAPTVTNYYTQIHAIDTQSIRDAVNRPNGILDIAIDQIARKKRGRDEKLRFAMGLTNGPS